MSIFVSFVSGAALFYLRRFFPYAALSLSLVLFLLFFLSQYRRYKDAPVHNSQKKSWLRLAASLILPLIFLSLGYYRAASSYVPPPDFRKLAGQVVEFKGRPVSEPLVLQSDRVRFLYDIEITEASVQGEALAVVKMRLFSESSLSPGKEYYVRAKIPGDSFFLNPGGTFGKDTFLTGYALEIHGTGTVNRNFLELARGQLNAYLIENFKGDVSAFLMSIITGERGSMSSEMRNAFNVTGLAHILSISGAHFGLLLFILFKAFKLLVRLLPHRVLARMTLYISPSQVAALLCLPVITAYLGISTMELPAVRSFIMITLFLFGLLIQRKGFWLNTLIFAAALIVLIWPDSLLQLSCQLSFLAVLCLGFYADINKRRQERLRTEQKDAEQGPDAEVDGKESQRSPQKVLRKVLSFSGHYVIASSMISLAATAGTAPLVAYSFNYFSIISPLSNLILTPFIGFVILPLSLASSFIYLIAGIYPLRFFIEAATSLSLELIKYIATWDFAAMPVPSFPAVLLVTFYSGLLGYAVISSRIDQKWDREFYMKTAVAGTIAVLPILVYVGISIFTERGMNVTFLDVGHGDSAMVELPDKRVMVIDTGKNGFQTAGFLKYRGCRKIDLLVLTHGHPDHSGGLRLLLNNFAISEIWDNGYMDYQGLLPENASRKSVRRGDFVEGRGYSITVFHPYEGFYTTLPEGQEDNDYSIVMKVEGKVHSFLFTGDASLEAEEDLSHLAEHLKSAVLKVPHHGSRTSSEEKFLYHVSPDIAVISVGKKNMYGHPHAETLALLSNTAMYRTDRDGAVGMTEMPDSSLKIRTWEGMRIKEAKVGVEELENIKKLFRVW